MSLLWLTAYNFWKFIISNYYFWKSFLNFSSKKDFALLVNDLLFLWEVQNFSDDDFLKYYENYPKEFIKKELQKRKDFKKKYKYIPTNWFVCNFMVLCDEFHQYFHNREHMSNFSWENKDFLTTLHQVRHYNTLMVLSTQDIGDLDLKFRKLASYEIETKQYWNLLFWFDLFTYHHKRNEEEKQFSKINKLPILKINWYFLNIIFKNIKKKFDFKFLNNIYNYIFMKVEKNNLPFNTKFNVNVTQNIYNEWDLYIKLNNFFKENQKNQNLFLSVD